MEQIWFIRKIYTPVYMYTLYNALSTYIFHNALVLHTVFMYIVNHMCTVHIKGISVPEGKFYNIYFFEIKTPCQFSNEHSLFLRISWINFKISSNNFCHKN